MRTPPLIIFAIASLLAFGSTAAAQGKATARSEPAVNTWTRAPGVLLGGYSNSALVYASERGCLLHWGAMQYARGIENQGNDVRAFDAATLKWSSDYPSDPRQSHGMTGGGNGAAISFEGIGRMLDSGHPEAAMMVNAVCYDSKRKQAIYSLPGLMAAYDPATKQWRDMKATTQLHGQTLPGGPPVYGAGMCYDPLNDEIVMFPQFGAQSADMRATTGRIQAHLGTLRYRFSDNTWRRVGHELGTAAVRQQRRVVVDLLGKISPALDKIWAAQAQQDDVSLAAAGKVLAACEAEASRLQLNTAAAALKTAASQANAHPAAAMRSGSEAIWALEGLLETTLAVEPTVRSVAPMVYDARHQQIVLFGGDSGRVRPDLTTPEERSAGDRHINDTWLYDCKTRQWSNVSKANRPPRQQVPHLVYDPESGLTLLVTVTGDRFDKRVPRKLTVWSFDAVTHQWSQRSEQNWDGELTDWYSVGLDVKHRLLVLCQTVSTDQVTWTMKLDVKSMPSKPAPESKTLAPEMPTAIPQNDAAWLAKLKNLPANTWTAAAPPQEPSRRDWGNIACDPVHGWMVYFGGGHSTYQATDTAVYVVGANRWVHQAGGHNNSIPSVSWGGYHMGARGSANAGHMRNAYVALDGRMYVNIGYGNHLKPREEGLIFTETEIVSNPAKPHSWFYDIDRGGVWRQLPSQIEGRLPEVERGRRDGDPWVADPKGKIYSIRLEHRRYENQPTGASFREFDIYRRKTKIVPIPQPWPNCHPESRPFCLLPDKNQIFYQDCDPKAKLFKTWVYDIDSNRFINLEPANQPQGIVAGVAFLEGQNAVLAAVDLGGRVFEQWVYSFKHNAWAAFPFDAEETTIARFFQAPYAQFDYVAKHGVLVNFNGRTYVMRPDISRLNWPK